MEEQKFELLPNHNNTTKNNITKRRLWIIGSVMLVLILIVCGAVALLMLVVIKSDNPPHDDPVQSVQCSGYGLKHVDNPDVCVCFACREGDDCSVLADHCELDLSMGQPLLLQEYWRDHPFPSSSIPPDFKTPYFSSVPKLDDAIKNLHAMVGNANTTNRVIVLGYGATQLLTAAFFAMNYLSKERVVVFSQTPYYTYADFLESNPSLGYFNDSLFLNASEVTEIVTSPNNPDGMSREAWYPNAKYHIYDLVYYWPGYTEIDKMYDEDIMMFSASKCTGHAANRMGWALVRDPLVARVMAEYIFLTTFGVSPDLGQKFNLIFQYIVSTQGNIFEHVRQILQIRYTTLLQILDSQPEPKRFSLVSKYGAFYLFIRCNLADDGDCTALFEQHHVFGRAGPYYGTGKEYVRFNFMAHDYEVDLFFSTLQKLGTQSPHQKKELLWYEQIITSSLTVWGVKENMSWCMVDLIKAPFCGGYKRKLSKIVL